MTRRAVVLAAALAAWGQTPVPQPTFRTGANYVRVDVYPTRNGAPIGDLTRDDFEILEGGQPQKIEQFERVDIRGGTPENTRIEPNTVRDSRAMAETTRGRIFVVFLDTGHVDVGGSHRIRQPLVTALNNLIGADDLVAFMTPQMSPRDITFARKTTTIEGMLARNWPWGERDRLNPPDPHDEQYVSCYPGRGPQRCPDGTTDDDRGVADEMIARRREYATLTALHDLMLYLRGVREERKAVIVITDGWLQFRENPNLARKLYCQIPTQQGPGLVPGTGRLTGRAPPDPRLGNASTDVCEAERQMLAYINDQENFRRLVDEANAANASFYPIDPRGLPVFDTPIDKMAPLAVDNAMLQTRISSLRTLAENTDGLAMVNSNDLNGSFQKIVADLSSYYLLGYYSTGKLDGKFHAITVKVKRPGVQVRARRGYLAALATVATSTTAIGLETAPPTVDAEAAARSAALLPLENYMRDVPLRLQAATGWKPGADPVAGVWVSGEFGGVTQSGDAWKGGAVVDVQLLTPAGKSIATATATIAAGARSFRVSLTPADPIPAGEYVIRVGARAGPAVIPSRESLRLQLPAAPGAAGALWIRRGPATANREVPTADLRFRRAEQVRVEIPTLTSTPVQARLLDRAGRTLAIPVTAATRDDADGSRWMTAQLALAAMAPGDYVIELSEGDRRMLTAFRIVP